MGVVCPADGFAHRAREHGMEEGDRELVGDGPASRASDLTPGLYYAGI